MKADALFCTSFCNKAHRMADGKPVGHECYVLPTEALVAERAGDFQRSQSVLAGWKNRRVHKGVKVST